MSRTDHVKGKIRKYQKEDESLIDCVKRASGYFKDAITTEDEAEDALYSEPLDKYYMIIGRQVYEKIEFKKEEFEGGLEDIWETDDVINFNLIFYNGGGCEEEIIQEYIQKQKNNE